MSDTFEAQCDCELDSPGALSHLPVEERLKHWTDWALYLKQRIETHYRPTVSALEHENERLRWMLDTVWSEMDTEFPYEVSEADYEGFLSDLEYRWTRREESEQDF